MSTVWLIIMVALYVAVPVWAIVWLIRKFRLSARGFRAHPYEPVEDPHAPDPVVRTRGVVVTVWLDIVWGSIHMLVLLFWLISGWPVGISIPAGMVAAYVAFGSVLTVAGGIQMSRCVAFGRTLATWGLFLIGFVAWMAAVGCLMAARYEETPEGWRVPIFLGALFFGAHMFLDGFLGHASRTRGVPAEAPEAT